MLMSGEERKTNPSGIELNKPVTQAALARLVGVSPQAMTERFKSGQIKRDISLGEALKVYCSQLRDAAAGRQGDEDDLTAARVETEHARAANLRIEYHEKLNNLIHVDQASLLIEEWAAFVAREVGTAATRYTREIESAHNIQIDEQLYETIIGAALERVADFTDESATAFEESES